MITVRPTIFCFLGESSSALYECLPAAMRGEFRGLPETVAFVAADERLRFRIGMGEEDRGAFSKGSGEDLADLLEELSSTIVRTNGARRSRATSAATASPAASEMPRDPFRAARRVPETYLVLSADDRRALGRLLPCAERLRRCRASLGDPVPVRVVLPMPQGRKAREKEGEVDAPWRHLRWLELALGRDLLDSCLLLGGGGGTPAVPPCDASLFHVVKLLTWLCDAEIGDEILACWSLEASGDSSNGHGKVRPSRRMILGAMATFDWRPDEFQEELAHLLLDDVRWRLTGAESPSEDAATDVEALRTLRSGAAGLLDCLLDEREEESAGGNQLRGKLLEWLRGRDPTAPPSGPGWRQRVAALVEKIGERRVHCERFIAQASRTLPREADASGPSEWTDSPDRGHFASYLPFLLVATVVCVSAALLASVSVLYLLTAILLLIVTTIVVGSLSSHRRVTAPRRRGRNRGRWTPVDGRRSAAGDALRPRAESILKQHRRQVPEARRQFQVLEQVLRDVKSLDAAMTALRAILPAGDPALDTQEAPSGSRRPTEALLSPRELRRWFAARGGTEQGARIASEVFARLEREEAVLATGEWLQREAREWAGRAARETEPRDLDRWLGRSEDEFRERLLRLAAPPGPARNDAESILFVYRGQLSSLARKGDFRREGRSEAICLRFVPGVRSTELGQD